MGLGVLEDLEGAFDLVLFPDVLGPKPAVLRRAAAQGEPGPPRRWDPRRR